MFALLVLFLVSPVPVASRQMLLVTTPDWSATQGTAHRYERSGAGAPWVAQGTSFPVSLGRSGLGWGRGLHEGTREGPLKKEGDGRSPAGVFALREVTGYAEVPPRLLRMPYRPATETLRCVDDSTSSLYNRLTEDRPTRDWASAEQMRRKDELYRWVVWVGHNDRPPAAGEGSCIFLHLRGAPDSTTAGCTAFDKAEMHALLGWLDPGALPVLVQLTERERKKLTGSWRLPRD